MRPSTTYILFFVFLDAGLSLTVIMYVPFLLSLGLSLADVSMINIWFWGAILAGEIPTGIFADRVSRGRAVQLGIALQAIGAVLYATATGFKSALAYEMILGFGSSWISGAAGAWIRDAMARRGEDAQYGKVIGTAAIARAGSMLIGGALGALISASFGFRVVWILTACFLFVALILSLLWMGPVGNPITQETDRCRIFAKSVNALRHTPGLRWVTVVCMAYGLVLPFNHYWTPYFIPRVGVGRMSMLWLVMYGCLAFAGYLIRKSSVSRSSEVRSILIAVGITGAGLALLPLSTTLWLSIALAGFHEIGRGLFAPLVEIFTQHRIESSYRATYSSLQSLLTKIGYVIVLVGVWWSTRGLPTNDATISMVWKAAGGILTLSVIVFWIFRPRISSRS